MGVPDRKVNATAVAKGLYPRRGACHPQRMIELMRTNDPVVISFIESLLRDAGIEFFIADQNMSIVEGSLGILPRRVMIDEERAAEARVLLADAGIGGEIGGA